MAWQAASTMLKESLAILQRNLSVVLIFLGVAAALSALRLTGDWLMFGGDFDGPRTSAQQTYLVGADIVMALVTAAVQVVVFNWLGAAADRPLWKVMPLREAFAKFYQLWLIINLLVLAGLQSIQWVAATAGENSGASLFLLWLVISGFALPYGAAVMFHRDSGRAELKLAVLALVDQLPRLLLVLLLWFAVNSLVWAVLLSQTLPVYTSPLLVVVLAYLDCVVFVYTWLLCVFHRDHPRDEDDWDF